MVTLHMGRVKFGQVVSTKFSIRNVALDHMVDCNEYAVDYGHRSLLLSSAGEKSML